MFLFSDRWWVREVCVFTSKTSQILSWNWCTLHSNDNILLTLCLNVYMFWDTSRSSSILRDMQICWNSHENLRGIHIIYARNIAHPMPMASHIIILPNLDIFSSCECFWMSIWLSWAKALRYYCLIDMNVDTFQLAQTDSTVKWIEQKGKTERSREKKVLLMEIVYKI